MIRGDSACPVVLRHPRGSDEAEYLALRAGSRGFLEPWEPVVEGLSDAPDAAFERLLATANTDRSQRFVVCLGAGGAIVGQCSLGEIIRGPLQQAFLGYWIAERYARKGHMTHALGLVLGHAFGALGLHRVEANIQPHNAASIALARRAGFRKEGYSPRYLRMRGGWADHERWAITAEEFAAPRG